MFSSGRLGVPCDLGVLQLSGGTMFSSRHLGVPCTYSSGAVCSSGRLGCHVQLRAMAGVWGHRVQ